MQATTPAGHAPRTTTDQMRGVQGVAPICVGGLQEAVGCRPPPQQATHHPPSPTRSGGCRGWPPFVWGGCRRRVGAGHRPSRARTHLGPEADGVGDGLHRVGVAADEEAAEKDAFDVVAHGVEVGQLPNVVGHLQPARGWGCSAGPI